MPFSMLQEYERILDEENPDLFKWLTGQQAAPDHLTRNSAYQALKHHVDTQMAEHCQVPSHAAAGVEWVRGWDDLWK
eukprot:jgi/Chrzof1/12644/Cz07g02050.t1